LAEDFMQAVDFSHYLIEEHVNEGEVVIDATCGNGRDTIFLARLVGSVGKVLAFDIQKEALLNTKNRLKKNGLYSRVELLHTGHENIDLYIKERSSAGIIFNLGYLPGGNKDIITGPDTTLKAVKSGLSVLKENGILVLVVYTGHSGGKVEKKSVMEYLAGLESSDFNVLHYYFLNQSRAPEVMAVIKRV